MLADPVAERLANHRVQVGALQPGQFLGNQCHALAPRTMHAGDVGAPEHASRAEHVEYTMQRVGRPAVVVESTCEAITEHLLGCDPMTLWTRER